MKPSSRCCADRLSARLSPSCRGRNSRTVGDVRESRAAHAVFEAGLAAVRQLAEAEGYEQLASEYAAEDANRRRLSRRRRPAWAADQ